MPSTAAPPPRVFTQLPVPPYGLPLPRPMGPAALIGYMLILTVVALVPLWPLSAASAQLFEPSLARLIPPAAWFLIGNPITINLINHLLRDKSPAGTSGPTSWPPPAATHPGHRATRRSP